MFRFAQNWQEALVWIAAGGVLCSAAVATLDPPGAPSPLELRSLAFADGGVMPGAYACGPDGSPAVPPLAWGSLPDQTASLAVLAVAARPADQASNAEVIWAVWNMPATATAMPETLADGHGLPGAAVRTRSHAGCDRHAGGDVRYSFYLYALDSSVQVPLEGSHADVEAAFRGHVLGRGLVSAHAR